VIVTDKEGDPPIVWNYLRLHAQVPWSTDLRVIGQLRSDLSLNAAVGYNGWCQDSCMMHVAFDSAHALTRELLREAFQFAFDTCSVVYGLTPITNEPALRFNKKLGFVEKYRTDHWVVQEMRKEACRWIRDYNGKRRITSTST